MQRFYVVWNPAGGPPSYRHPHYASAIAEARRLARGNPAEQFIVLAALATAKVRDPVEVTDFDGPLTIPSQPDTDEIPF